MSGQLNDDGSLVSLQIEIVVPVLNEEGALGPSVRRLVSCVRARFPFRTINYAARNQV